MTGGVPSPGVTPVLVSVWPVVSVNRLFAASLSEIESAAADCGLTGTRPLLLSAHTFSHRENPHHTVQMQTVCPCPSPLFVQGLLLVESTP